VLPLLLEGDRDTVGERLARFVASILESPEGRARVLGVVRAAASEPEAARMLREFLRGELWAPLARQLGIEDAELRVTLAGSQIVGMVMARHVIEVEPLAALSADELATLLAPTFQRYLVGELRRS
jgi:hypothetical protein